MYSTFFTHGDELVTSIINECTLMEKVCNLLSVYDSPSVSVEEKSEEFLFLSRTIGSK